MATYRQKYVKQSVGHACMHTIQFQSIAIENCGELAPGDPWDIEENDGTDDVYPPWPNDWDLKPEDDEKVIKNAINKIKDSGNYFFKENNYIDSERKYIKALRYIDWFIGLDKSKNKNAVEELRMNSLLNLAAARLKRNKNSEVIDLCSEVFCFVKYFCL
jgi:hypothetical protein